MSTSSSRQRRVWLAKCPDYLDPDLQGAISGLLDSLLQEKGMVSGSQPGDSSQIPEPILIKPNFISQKNSSLCCTHPRFIQAVAIYFNKLGKKVIIADSPAFGRATRIAKDLGLPALCQGFDVDFMDFKEQCTLELSFGERPSRARIKVARQMLEAGLIVNLPKCKVHKQLALTGAVKNFFGAVVGTKKALIHVRFGDHTACFAQLLLGLSTAFTQSISLLDGILAMHQDGPINGQGYPLGIIGGSTDPLALDTAIAAMLGLQPDQVPIWAEARRQKLPGAFLENIDFPKLTPFDIPCPGFETITALKPVSFRPFRLLKSSIQRLLARL